MEGSSRLDALARDLAGGRVSRRTALRRFAGGAVGIALPTALIAEPALARCPPSRKCGSKCCPPGQRCKNRKCKCKGGLTKCGRKCFDVANDPVNCGVCGRACAPGQTCTAGQCTGGGTTTQPVCGDGKAEGTEICDGADLKGATCQSLGFLGGTLACAGNCTYDMSGCTSPQCATAADCPQGPPGDCQKAVCTSGTCGFVADNTEVPADDGNPCTTSTCTNGVPSHVNAAAGQSCGAGMVCNGSGGCGVCVPGSQQSCYTGPPGTEGVGVCHAGTRTCLPNGSGYGACTGQVVPQPETCNGLDDDCDGTVDDGVDVGNACNCGGNPGTTICIGAAGICCSLNGTTCCGDVCGDGVITGAEECDDGGVTDGDGCSSTCQIEPGWQCAGQPSVCTPM